LRGSTGGFALPFKTVCFCGSVGLRSIVANPWKIFCHFFQSLEKWRDMNWDGTQRSSILWIRLFWIGIAAFYAALFLFFFNRVGLNDNDQFLMFHELQFWNSNLFGFSKQWTPMLVGGISMAGDPQIPLLSLSMMLSYVLGPFYGLRLATILYFIIGWAGAWLYSGLVLKRFEAQALAASLFIGNGFFVCRMAHGHIDHIPFLTLPLVLWALHRLPDLLHNLNGVRRLMVGLSVVLLLGAGLSVVVDGSPVAIIHYLFWVMVYAAILAVAKRSWIPILIPVLACGVTALLDAGFLWPMLVEQQHFPRLTKNTFTNPLCLLWFMLLPAGGRLIPAPANGHEYSVYIGPVLAWLIWRYRRELAALLPKEMRWPLLVTGVVTIILGMGSLRVLGVPEFLSPFDLLRKLPGFRSIDVTGRYWGFLALPLSLLAALGLQHFLQDSFKHRRAGVWLGVALALQFGFMSAFLVRSIAFSKPYQPVAYQGLFPKEGADISYSRGGAQIYQYDLISPVKGLLDAYNMGDFIHPDMDPGVCMFRKSFLDGVGQRTRQWVRGRFLNWNHIQVNLIKAIPQEYLQDDHTLRLVFNQAWHRYWSCPTGRVTTDNGRNLAVDVPLRAASHQPIDLIFHDPVSERGARVSQIAWQVWLILMLISGFVSFSIAGRKRLSLRNLPADVATAERSRMRDHFSPTIK
jgi:hypothetical protein